MSMTDKDEPPTFSPPCPLIPHPFPSSFIRRANLLCHLCGHISEHTSARCRSSDCLHGACVECTYSLQVRTITCPWCDENHEVDPELEMRDFMCRKCESQWDASWIRGWAVFYLCYSTAYTRGRVLKWIESGDLYDILGSIPSVCGFRNYDKFMFDEHDDYDDDDDYDDEDGLDSPLSWYPHDDDGEDLQEALEDMADMIGGIGWDEHEGTNSSEP